jgi:hypothetical protein
VSPRSPGPAPLAERLAVSRDVADVWLEAHAAVDAAGRVRGFGDDDPSVASFVSGPPSGNAQEVGR